MGDCLLVASLTGFLICHCEAASGPGPQYTDNGTRMAASLYKLGGSCFPSEDFRWDSLSGTLTAAFELWGVHPRPLPRPSVLGPMTHTHRRRDHVLFYVTHKRVIADAVPLTTRFVNTESKCWLSYTFLRLLSLRTPMQLPWYEHMRLFR